MFPGKFYEKPNFWAFTVFFQSNVLPNCIEPIDEIQIVFDGPIIIEKGIEQFFLASNDRFPIYLQ